MKTVYEGGEDGGDGDAEGDAEGGGNGGKRYQFERLNQRWVRVQRVTRRRI